MGMLDVIRNNSSLSPSRSKVFNDPLFRRIDRLFDDLTRDLFSGTMPSVRSEVFNPDLDVEDRGSEIAVTLDLPGLKKEDINIEISGNTLIVTGERKDEMRDEKANSQYYERRFGRFERQFTLPQDVNPDTVKAHYENGVLQLNLPKMESRQRKSIPIHDTSSRQISAEAEKSEKGTRETELKSVNRPQKTAS